MIFRLLVILSQTIATTAHLLAGLFLQLSRSEKTRLFISERANGSWEKAIADAQREKIRRGWQHRPTYWIHVASAGELEQVIPILKALNAKHGVVFFLTYFSPSAIPFLKNCPALLAASSLPWESKSSFRLALVELDIRRLVLVRYDFWPVLISTFSKAGKPICIVAATLKKARSPLPSIMQKQLRKIWFRNADAIFLVDGKEKSLLSTEELKGDVLHVAGDAKWLRARERALNSKSVPLSRQIAGLAKLAAGAGTDGQKPVWVFGSPHQEELQVLQRLLDSHLPPMVVVVAPHEVDSQTIAALKKALQRTDNDILQISQCGSHDWQSSADNDKPVKIVFLDTFGFLAEAYALAEVAVVGGGFDGQLHNVLEPAAFLVPTLFGNRASRAPEAQILLTSNAAVGFATSEMLFQFLHRWGTLKNDSAVRSEMSHLKSELRMRAEALFASLPDTSEVVCRVLASKDALETT
ncbi:MAG: hypothetical protein RLZZ488_488 [Pseudomonadota bacterium]|jgi:3-deoxy-D-manno-octulosonic-acid transferase